MKLATILEDFTASRQGLQNTASGGLLKASGLWATSDYDHDAYQNKKDLALLNKVKSAGENGFAGELDYEDRNRLQNLQLSAMVDSFGGRWFITEMGMRWLDSFKERNQNWTRSYMPSYSMGITGIGK